MTWILVKKELPPEGVKVVTLSEGGIQAELTRHGNLFFTDGGMYVYYVPVMWHPI